ncbi:MAG: hypothetical protein C0623_03550 [Desulfuromonas sp.]|nr:MAG: hypothetical protein C0623_03550 [Desulfuromonas sp.]
MHHLFIKKRLTLFITLILATLLAGSTLADAQPNITLPEIGETITTERAIELCRHYRFQYLVDRITAHPERYKSWRFDGVSMAPDGLFAWLFGIPNITEIALRHDLKYAYGEKGNTAERRAADLALKQEIKEDGGSAWIARVMFKAVNRFGKEKYQTSYSWAFAHY